jgi:cytochrome P450
MNKQRKEEVFVVLCLLLLVSTLVVCSSFNFTCFEMIPLLRDYDFELSGRSIAVVFILGVVAWVFRTIQELKRRKQKLPFDDIPYTVPNPHWFLGHLSLLGNDVIQGQHSVCVEHAGGSLGVSTFYTLGEPVLSVLDAEAAERILKFTSERRGNPTTVRHFKKMFGEQSILMTNGKEWRANRDIVQRSFAHASLPDLEQSLLGAALRVERTLLATVQNQPDQFLEMDALNLTRIAALDAFGISSLGHDFGCTKDNKLNQSDVFRMTGYLQSEVTRRTFHERLNPFAHFYWIPTRANRRHRREHTLLRQTIRDIIHQRQQELVEGKEPVQRDLLGSVLKGSDGFTEMSDEFLSDWMITMLFGGYETSSLGLCYSLYLLAKHSTYQTECALEAQRVLGSIDNESTLDGSKDLPFIYACFWEALRCYPPTTMTARNLDRKLVLDMDGKQRTIPKGSRVAFSIYWINRSEMNFPRPDEYLPERWAQKQQGKWVQRTAENDSGEGVALGRRSYMLSFSAGARNCVGQPLALRMIPTLLAVLLRSFEFELADPAYKLKLGK